MFALDDLWRWPAPRREMVHGNLFFSRDLIDSSKFACQRTQNHGVTIAILCCRIDSEMRNLTTSYDAEVTSFSGCSIPFENRESKGSGDWAARQLSTMRRVVGLLSLAAALGSCNHTGSEPANPTPPSAASRLPVAFTVNHTALTDPSWPQVRELLQPGDFVYYNATGEDPTTMAIPNAQQLAQNIPGIHVVYYERTTLNTVYGTPPPMDTYLTANPLPGGIEYVAYDWEPTYMPEFAFCETGPPLGSTTCSTILVAGGPVVQTTIDPYPGALTYFNQATTIAAAHGKKLFPTPFNPYRIYNPPNPPYPWNEGLVSQTISAGTPSGAGYAIDVQTQGDIKPGDLSVFQQHVQSIASDVQNTTPALTLFFEISYNLSSATDVLNAALWVQETRQGLLPNGTIGVFVIYTNLSQMVSLLQGLHP